MHYTQLHCVIFVSHNSLFKTDLWPVREIISARSATEHNIILTYLYKFFLCFPFCSRKNERPIFRPSFRTHRIQLFSLFKGCYVTVRNSSFVILNGQFCFVEWVVACVIWTLDKGQASPTVLQGAVNHRAVQWERDGHLVEEWSMKQEVINRFFGLYPTCLFIQAAFRVQYNNVSATALHYFWPHPPVMKMQWSPSPYKSELPQTHIKESPTKLSLHLKEHRSRLHPAYIYHNHSPFPICL